MWLVLYPEGTRYTAKGKAKSDEVALKQGLKPYAGELLLPRTKGFCMLAAGLAPKFKSVVDMTIAYVGPDGKLVPWHALGTNSLWEAFAGRLPLSRVHIHLRVYKTDLLPPSEEGLKKWCLDRWDEKEALLAQLAQSGSFPVPQYHGVCEVPPPAAAQDVRAAILAAGAVFFWAAAATSPLFRGYLFWASLALAWITLNDSPLSTN